MMLLLACAPLGSVAQADGRPEEADLELKLQNPITALVIVQFLSTVDLGRGEGEENRTVVSAQAQVPIRVTRDWHESEATLDCNRQEGERWAMPLQASMSKVARVGAPSVNLLPGGRW